MAHTALREDKAGILIYFFSIPKETQAMGKGAVVGGAAPRRQQRANTEFLQQTGSMPVPGEA